jgi:hypothetical protein
MAGEADGAALRPAVCYLMALPDHGKDAVAPLAETACAALKRGKIAA